jgi:hypothetical protein
MSYRWASLAVFGLMCTTPLLAQKPSEKASGNKPAMKSAALSNTAAYLDALRKNTTTAGKVALAEAAGPVEIAHHATIIEMTSTMESKTLRAGTNGWTCIADPKGPMCVDATFMSFAGAMMNKLTPNVTKVSIGYMLVGDAGASLSDPFASAPTADWVKSGAHTMVLVPDATQLDGMSTDPASGGPYVMWKGTPYAHVMVPSK